MSKHLEMNRRFLLAGAGALGAAAIMGGPRLAFGQEKFPSRAINWIVYQAPGGSHDVTTRIIEPKLSAILGVPIAVENITGANGRVARARVFNARPDGYTLLTENSNSIVLGEIFFEGAYKSEEFEPVFGWERTGYQICVKKDSPIRTFEDLKNETQKRRVVVATIGHGGDAHLQMLLISDQLKMPMQLVHFDGSSEAYAAVMGGHVDAAIAGAGSGSRNAENLHFLAVTNTVREFALPDVPTIIEQGFDVDILVRIWYALTTPGVPEDRLQILASAFEEAFQDKELLEQQAAAGVSSMVVPRQDIKAEIVKFKERAVQYKGLLAT